MKKTEKNQSRGLLALIRDRKGMSTVEYAILLAVITVVAFTTWQKFGEKIEKSVGNANTTLAI